MGRCKQGLFSCTIRRSGGREWTERTWMVFSLACCRCRFDTSTPRWIPCLADSFGSSRIPESGQVKRDQTNDGKSSVNFTLVGEMTSFAERAGGSKNGLRTGTQPGNQHSRNSPIRSCFECHPGYIIGVSVYYLSILDMYGPSNSYPNRR